MERERAAGAQAEAMRLRGKRWQAERLPYNSREERRVGERGLQRKAATGPVALQFRRGGAARRQSGVATGETASAGYPHRIRASSPTIPEGGAA